MSVTLIYITASSRDEALKLARQLVAERLVACANVFEGATSLYWWEGKVQEESEAVLVAKTSPDLVETVTARVKALHSYGCPCVVALPIIAGNPDFLAWISKETRSEGTNDQDQPSGTPPPLRSR